MRGGVGFAMTFRDVCPRLLYPGAAPSEALPPGAALRARLEFLESANQLGAEHPGEHFGAGLAVPVLAGERSAVADDKIGCLFDEPPVLFHAVGRLQTEIQARVDAAVSEMAVEARWRCVTGTRSRGSSGRCGYFLERWRAPR